LAPTNSKPACVDTGSTNQLLRLSDASAVRQQSHLDPITVKFPNGDTINSISSGTFHLPNLPTQLRAHIFADKDLDMSLVSVAELCNAGCEAILKKDGFKVINNGKVVLSAPKYPSETLWKVSMPSNPTELSDTAASSNAAISLRSSDEFVLFVHASMGSPPTSTFFKSVNKGFLRTWSRLTSNMVSKHPPHTISTAKEHLNQGRKGLNSTKEFILVDSDDSVDEDDSPELSPGKMYVTTIYHSHTTSSDLTGRFPVVSQTGSQNILVTVMDGYIHPEPMASRSSAEYLKAYKNTVEFFRNLGHKPDFQRLDNETSGQLEKYMRQQEITFQYCEPGAHLKRAEKAVQDFKNHFISTLATTSSSMPLCIWDKLLPQIELCINHLRPYQPNPNISAYAGIHGGPHDFTAHPIAPAGTRVLIHDKPAARATWANHGTPGYYLGPALDHYRSFSVYCTETKSPRTSATLAWFPENFIMPSASAAD
jgi:hypothetical protein